MGQNQLVVFILGCFKLPCRGEELLLPYCSLSLPLSLNFFPLKYFSKKKKEKGSSRAVVVEREDAVRERENLFLPSYFES